MKHTPEHEQASTRPTCYRCKGTGFVTGIDLNDLSKCVFPCEECTPKRTGRDMKKEDAT